MLLTSEPIPGDLNTVPFAVIKELPDPDYRKLRRLSKSECDLLNDCPAKYRYIKDHPEDREETDALTFGRAIHSAILTPDEFAKDFTLLPKFVGRGAVNAKRAWAEENASKTPLKPDSYEKIERMREALFNSVIARKLFWDWQGDSELTALWASQLDPSVPPVLCKGRMDRVVTSPDGNKIIVDLKTTESADPHDFPRKCFYQYRYHVQAASYIDGLRDASGDNVDSFIFVAIEKEPPYLIACYVSDDAFLQVGRAHYLKNVKTYAECCLSGNWPGYPTELIPLTSPGR
jgi:exodeoxyribonuclease VIII